MNDLDLESLILAEITMVLAEKRTSLATMRTGIAVFALPLSVVSVLIATSDYYEFKSVAYLFLPLLAICGGLVILGAFLVHRSVQRIGRQDSQIMRLKNRCSYIETPAS